MFGVGPLTIKKDMETLEPREGQQGCEGSGAQVLGTAEGTGTVQCGEGLGGT